LADTRSRAGKFAYSVILFAKSECQTEWRKYCKLASEFTGLPEEEAGEKWLSREVPFQFSSVREECDSQLILVDSLADIENEILNRLKSALDRRAWLLNDFEEQTAPPSLVTFEALKEAVDFPSSDVMLRKEILLLGAWLAPAEARQEPRPDAVSHEEAPAAVLPELKKAPEPVIHEEILRTYERAWAKDPPISRKVEDQLVPEVQSGLQDRGYTATPYRIATLARKPLYNGLRWRPGKKKWSEDEIAKGRKRLAELKAAEAKRKAAEAGLEAAVDEFKAKTTVEEA
jgi:hypothetical protein